MSDVADEMMPTATMKVVLKTAQTPGTTVPIAVGLDADKNAVILAARKGKAKGLRKAYVAAAKKKKLDLKTDGQTLFFGYGSVDKGAEGILKLMLNKTPPGGELFAMKVFKLVKGAGFGKVVLSVDDGLENEKDEEEEAQEREVGEAQERLHDEGELKRALGQMVPQIGKVGETNPKLAEALKHLAGTAAEGIKAGKLADAATAIAKLKSALTLALQSGPAGKVDLAKPRLVWLASRNKALGEAARLRTALSEHYEPQGVAKAIVARYDAVVDELFGPLDESLADALDAANAAPDADARAKKLEEARSIIGRYEAAIDAPRFKELENNPFEKLALGEMLGKSLQVLSTTLR